MTKLKCTKALATLLNKNTPNDYYITLEKLTPNQYALCVDTDIYNHDNDFNATTNTFNVLKVNYQHDYYALPRYITTNDLRKIYFNAPYSNFFREFEKYIEI